MLFWPCKYTETRNILYYSENIKLHFNFSIFWLDDKSILTATTITSGGRLLIGRSFLFKTLELVLELEIEHYATFTLHKGHTACKWKFKQLQYPLLHISNCRSSKHHSKFTTQIHRSPFPFSFIFTKIQWHVPTNCKWHTVFYILWYSWTTLTCNRIWTALHSYFSTSSWYLTSPHLPLSLLSFIFSATHPKKLIKLINIHHLN